jgi:predicted  nucleic acid-binding Zn-ribbon protein
MYNAFTFGENLNYKTKIWSKKRRLRAEEAKILGVLSTKENEKFLHKNKKKLAEYESQKNEKRAEIKQCETKHRDLEKQKAKTLSLLVETSKKINKIELKKSKISGDNEKTTKFSEELRTLKNENRIIKIKLSQINDEIEKNDGAHERNIENLENLNKKLKQLLLQIYSLNAKLRKEKFKFPQLSKGRLLKPAHEELQYVSQTQTSPALSGFSIRTLEGGERTL